MTSTLRFPTHQNFMDQQLTSDGQPYGPIRYKELVRECYLISKNLNTSYMDVLKLTPREKDYILEFIVQDAESAKKLIEDNKRNIQKIQNK